MNRPRHVVPAWANPVIPAAYRPTRPGGPRCVECGRVFDLGDPVDADEWSHGHDCEEPPPDFHLMADYDDRTDTGD